MDDSIQFFGIVVDDVVAAGKIKNSPSVLTLSVQKARDLGYSVDEENVIRGPDSYPYKPIQKPADSQRKEPFAGIRLRVSSLERSLAFYKDVIGMQVLDEAKVEVPLGSVKEGVKAAYICFQPSDCVYQLIEDPEK